MQKGKEYEQDKKDLTEMQMMLKDAKEEFEEMKTEHARKKFIELKNKTTALENKIFAYDINHSKKK